MLSRARLALAAALALSTAAAQAADWSDTSIGYRTGDKFAEPFGATDIHKDILDFNHVSGYKYGSNFFNIDLLLSDDKDPASVGSKNGAQEVYIVYRHTLDLEKTTGTAFKWGPVRGLGLTLGFDANVKNDAGYNSKKRMLVAGPTVNFDVPGFLAVSLLELWESNAPYNGFTGVATPRYSYDPHPMLTAAWGIPIGSLPLSFEGYANFIAAKGKDEFGADTKPETNIDMQVMYDVTTLFGGKNTFKLGIEYQYWLNKFGNDHKGPAGDGAFAKSPMIRAEYHF
ncbi:outer envelope protein [Ideonella sp.]|uniref:outer envelope protein n=1 Tax=Ideonella sp. TaxID=1929293 RepID=UPI002B470777|nr:outer envelope protein [Ideonella sp.]HJV70553.1 outer envelope protein [Ideonella sp.]